jgi:hypothetical protein
MKRSTKIILLLGILAVLIVGIILVRKLSEKEDTEETEAAAVVYSTDSTSITRLTWTYNNETVSFSRQGENWVYEDDADFPTDNSYLEAMATTLATIEADRVIDDPGDLAQYGLDDPICSMTVETSSGTTTLNFGDENTISSERYLTNGDGKVYLVKAEILSSFSYNLLDVVKKETVPEMKNVTSFVIQRGEDTLTLVYTEEQETGTATSTDAGTTEETGTSGTWSIQNGDTKTEIDNSKAVQLKNNVAYLSWLKCVNYRASDSELEDYGFLPEPVVSATIQYSDSDGAAQTFTLELGNYTGDYCYARIAGSKMVYLVKASIAENLLSASAETLAAS